MKKKKLLKQMKRALVECADCMEMAARMVRNEDYSSDDINDFLRGCVDSVTRKTDEFTAAIKDLKADKKPEPGSDAEILLHLVTGFISGLEAVTETGEEPETEPETEPEKEPDYHGCDGCRHESLKETDYPCCECSHAHLSMWRPKN